MEDARAYAGLSVDGLSAAEETLITLGDVERNLSIPAEVWNRLMAEARVTRAEGSASAGTNNMARPTNLFVSGRVHVRQKCLREICLPESHATALLFEWQHTVANQSLPDVPPVLPSARQRRPGLRGHVPAVSRGTRTLQLPHGQAAT